MLAGRGFGILPRRNRRSCPSHDLPTVPERRLLSVSPKRRIRPSVQRPGTAALALPFVRPAVSCFGGGAVVLGLRALSALREFRPRAHFLRPRRQGHDADAEKMACVPGLPLRPLPPAIFQRAAVPAHPTRDDIRCASQGLHHLKRATCGPHSVMRKSSFRRRRYRLKVRTEPSQGSNPGSSPGIATKNPSFDSLRCG